MTIAAPPRQVRRVGLPVMVAGRLAAALAGMKRAGSYRRIFDLTLMPLAAGR